MTNLVRDDMHLGGRAHESIARAAAVLINANVTVNAQSVNNPANPTQRNKDDWKKQFRFVLPPGS
jgi:hypothetical protein